MWIRHAMSVFHWNLKDVHSCLYNKVLLKHDGPEKRLFLRWLTREQRVNPPELVELVSHHHCWTVTVSAGLRLPPGCKSKQRRRVINYTVIEKCVSLFREVSLCWLSHWTPPSINTVWCRSRAAVAAEGSDVQTRRRKRLILMSSPQWHTLPAKWWWCLKEHS